VPRDSREAQFLEYRLKQALVRRAEFDEFEAVQAKGVLEKVGHDESPLQDSFNCNYIRFC
jgi:hypothetical protein